MCIRDSPKIEGVELKNATVDLEKGVVVVEYGQEDIEKDVAVLAVDFESAVDYLRERLYQPAFTTEKHLPKLEALNQLTILAEAWNSFDEFEPDWTNRNQYKHYPFFKFINGKFEFKNTGSAQIFTDTHVSNFAFKTKERAEQFGRQFIDLF